MSCVSCGSPLPVGAMFCGECGRAVSAVKPVSLVSRPGPEEHPYPYPTTVEEAGEHCPQCGAGVRHNDIFCSECGFVVHASAQRNRDTIIVDPIDPIDPIAPVEPWLPNLGDSAVVDPVAAGALGDTGWLAEADKPANAHNGPDSREEPDGRDGPDGLDEPDDGRALPPSASPLTSAAFLFDDADHEHTRIVPRRDQGERFILQFSTGESVTVFGSGLLGRNPVPEPGEFFDQFVAISDPGKSVSKTHLEFGQEAGAFWVSDRFSGNGSVVREPDQGARRCEPGKRYRMVRGSRVDIGEQFFVVS